MPPTSRRVIIVRVVVVIVALVAGGYLFFQGELSKNITATVPANPPAPALSSASASASASPSGTAPARELATPPAEPAMLPPVSTAPGIVQAIDHQVATPPAGFTLESFSAARLGTTAGFTVATPAGWQSVPSGPAVKLEGPDGSSVEIDLTRHVKTNMVSQAEYLRGLLSSEFPGYQRIFSPQDQPLKKFIQPETIHQTLGALWEFDWVTGSGVQLREDVLLFTLDRQSYTIYAAGPAGTNDNDWNLSILGTVSSILRTFTPVAS